MENLNKEDFWNPLHQDCPTAVSYFCDWIDRYKKEVKWNEMFGENVKFHDIPFEMQNGIIARFELELFNNKNGNGQESAAGIARKYRVQIIDLFRDLQRSIDNRSITLN